MSAGDRVKVEQIPYINVSQAGGKFVSSLLFYDSGKWRGWFPVGNDEFMESDFFPSEGGYYGQGAEKASDLNLHFLNFIVQHASYLELEKPFFGIKDDLFNMSASLAKISHIHATRSLLRTGDRRMVVTEVEYLFSLCRSMIDLFQEVAATLWSKVVLFEGIGSKRKDLPKSFRAAVSYQGRPATIFEIQEKFGVPFDWAVFYVRHADFFFKIRKFRDNVVHNGSQVDSIFSTELGYYVAPNFQPFASFRVWGAGDEIENGLVPILPALGMLVYKTLLLCDDFSFMLERILTLPEKIVPGMNYYLRGHFDEHFAEILSDVEQRIEAFAPSDG